MAKTSDPLKWSLRILAIISAFIGIGFIIWAIVIQSPPKTALPVGLIILGVLGIVIAIIGILLAACGRACMSLFLLSAFLVTLGELAIIISLFVNLDGAVNSLVQYSIQSSTGNNQSPTGDNKGKNKGGESPSPPPSRRLLATNLTDLEQKYRTELEIGRYVFLVAVIIEFIVLLIVVIIKVRNPHQAEGDSVDDQRAARSAIAQIQMESLKSSVQKGNSKNQAENNSFYSSSGKMYRSMTKKISQKYGEFTQDPAFQKKWWQGIPGFK